MGRNLVLASLAATAAMGFPGAVLAQSAAVPCQLCAPGVAQADDAPKTPLTLQIDTGLQFDRLIMATQGYGSAEVQPDGSARTSGSIASMGARTMVGEVTVTGEPNRFVRVSLPSTIMLMGLSGGGIRVESIKSDLGAMPRLDGNGHLTFRFGGVVRVDGDLDGEFRGDMPIDVDYF